MTNALMHKVQVEDKLIVETVGHLHNALLHFYDLEADAYLDKTYAVELLSEKMSDGSIARSIRIREAEATA